MSNKTEGALLPEKYKGCTPGPWHRNIPPATKYATVWAGQNTHVAAVKVQGLSEAEVEQNIQLIADAPALACEVERLKEALVSFIYETTHLSPEDDKGQHRCFISKACLEKARAALGKDAEGGA